MITFIKDDSLEIMKIKLFLLYLLNVSDILFTLLLLQTGYFTEVNIFMLGVVKSPLISIALKGILPAVLLYNIYRQHQEEEEEQRKISNIAVNISLTIYSLVNLSHIIWTVSLPFLMKYYA